MRLQFHYQLKEFDQADEILATCGFLRGPMMMDPMAVAMRMARCYKNDDLAGAEKGLQAQDYVVSGRPRHFALRLDVVDLRPGGRAR